MSRSALSRAGGEGASERPADEPRPAGRRGLHAEVAALAIVGSPEPSLAIQLTITAVNPTDETLALDEPYVFPQVQDIDDIKAWDDQGALDHSVDERLQILVHFGGRPALGPRDRYTWNISYRCRGPLHMHLGNTVAGRFKVRAQEIFQGRKVESHRFRYEFRFLKPLPKWRWLFKTIQVSHVDSKRSDRQMKRRWSHSSCVLPFTLLAGEFNRIEFTARYQYSSRLIALLAFVLGSGLTHGIRKLWNTFELSTVFDSILP